MILAGSTGVRMLPVAISDGVRIYCPENGRFSFFNSPYPAHHSFSAIDVYPTGRFGYVAPSPVRGVIVGIRRVECPSGRGFKSSTHDCVIIVRSSENPKRLIKILHVDPIVNIGDRIEPGDDLGRLIRSGFFDFWTDPHIHIEVRKPSDPIRARGGLQLERLMDLHDNGDLPDELRGLIVKCKPEYSLIDVYGDLKFGLHVEVDGELGILDAGIPHYGRFGIHMTSQPIKGEVMLCGKKIGRVMSIHANMCIAECSGVKFSVNGRNVGLSLLAYPHSKPLLKIVPRKSGTLNLKESQEVTIDIEP